MAQAKKQVTVTLEGRDDKQKSVKFVTQSDVSPDNLYLKNEVVEKLGNPSKIKVTIEPA